MDIKNFGNVGWICPKCGRVMGPFESECFYCNKPGYGPTVTNPCTPISPTISVTTKGEPICVVSNKSTTSGTDFVRRGMVQGVADTTTSIDNSTTTTGTTTAKMNTDDAAAASNENNDKKGELKDDAPIKTKDELLDAISEAESFNELLNAFTECLFPGIHDKE